jgi:hypothetical protein
MNCCDVRAVDDNDDDDDNNNNNNNNWDRFKQDY